MLQFTIHDERKFVDAVKRKYDLIAKKEPVVGSYLWGYEDDEQCASLTVVLNKTVEEVKGHSHIYQRTNLKGIELETVLSSIEEYQLGNESRLPYMEDSCRELQNAILLQDTTGQLKKTQEYYQQQTPHFTFDNQRSFSPHLVKKLETKFNKSK